jgi:hypothetical protein
MRASGRGWSGGPFAAAPIAALHGPTISHLEFIIFFWHGPPKRTPNSHPPNQELDCFMPITPRFNEGLLIFEARGTITIEDFFRAWKSAVAAPGVRVPLDTLIDLRASQIDVPGHEIESTVYRLKRLALFDKMAFVADRGSFSYAMGRMFCINAEYIGCRSEIFLTVDEALDWLASDNHDQAGPDKEGG